MLHNSESGIPSPQEQPYTFVDLQTALKFFDKLDKNFQSVDQRVTLRGTEDPILRNQAATVLTNLKLLSENYPPLAKKDQAVQAEIARRQGHSAPHPKETSIFDITMSEITTAQRVVTLSKSLVAQDEATQDAFDVITGELKKFQGQMRTLLQHQAEIERMNQLDRRQLLRKAGVLAGAGAAEVALLWLGVDVYNFFFSPEADARHKKEQAEWEKSHMLSTHPSKEDEHGWTVCLAQQVKGTTYTHDKSYDIDADLADIHFTNDFEFLSDYRVDTTIDPEPYTLIDGRQTIKLKLAQDAITGSEYLLPLPADGDVSHVVLYFENKSQNVSHFVTLTPDYQHKIYTISILQPHYS